VRAGWGTHDVGRWLALALCAVAWGIVLGSWLHRQGMMSAQDHQRGMYQALGAWALTDVAVVLVWGT
jgi:hypothetical protein